MTRREVLAFAAGVPLAYAQPGESLFGTAQGVAVAIDASSGRLLSAHRISAARTLLAPPGSTMKPLALFALLQAGKLRATDTHLCSGQLKIHGRSYACSHPRMSAPIDLPTAIAYSCNEYVAHAAARIGPGELGAALDRFGLSSRTMLADGEAAGRIERVSTVEANQLQALGEEHVAITVLHLAIAYRRLAVDIARAEFASILTGLEDAVEFGTGQRAALGGVKVAGKTGTAARQYAWFAGFAPSRSPRVIAAVMVQGRAGGADAAPIGGKLLAAHLRTGQ